MSKGNKEQSGPKMLLMTYLKIFRQEKNYIKDFQVPPGGSQTMNGPKAL